MSGRVRVAAVGNRSSLGNLVKRKRSASQDEVIKRLKLSDLRKPVQDSKYAVKRLDPSYQKPRTYNMEEYTGLWACMPAMEIWYDSFEIQMAVAGLIFANFITSAWASQLVADQSQGTVLIFKLFEYFFTYIFTLELLVNMYAHGSDFWLGEQYGWNLFDFIVVGVSLLSLVTPNLPGISVLRLLRAFRVFRLFKRLKSLRQIIKALEASIPGVANAFAILLLVIGIYAILGVEFFRKASPEYFSSFSESMFSLFQVMTGESWAEMVARPIMDGMAPNCIVEYIAPMRGPDESIRYPWETPGHYSTSGAILHDGTKLTHSEDHPNHKKHYAGMRSHYVGTFNCFVDDAALLKNAGKVDLCNEKHEQRIRETCKGSMRLAVTDQWWYNNGNDKKGTPQYAGPGIYYNDGTRIDSNHSFIETNKPYKLIDPTQQPDKTIPGMDPDKCPSNWPAGLSKDLCKERFYGSGLAWKKSTLWLRPKGTYKGAKGYKSLVYMEGLVKTGIKDANGDPDPCDAAWMRNNPGKKCEPDGIMHWYSYEDYTRIYGAHNKCGTTITDSEGVHAFPKYGGPPGKAPAGLTSGVIDIVKGYYPQVMANTYDCASTVTQIVGDRSEKVTRVYNHKRAIEYAMATNSTVQSLDASLVDVRALGKVENAGSTTSQGLSGYKDGPFPQSAGVTNSSATGYQYGQIPCPLYMQKDPPIVKEARCYDYYVGQGKEECINHCLPIGLGSIYFVTFILFCGYMLVNVAISIVIEKMMEKDDADDSPERVYDIIRLPNDNEMVILLRSKDEKAHIINPDDPQHNHYRLPDNEIWIFEKGDAPSIQKFPPIAIRSVDGDEKNPEAPRMEDDESRKILQGPRFGFTGDELTDACERTVTIQLWDKLIQPDGTGVIKLGPKQRDAVQWESNHKILVEPPPPTVDDIENMEDMKDRLRDSIDTLFIKMKPRLGKILNQINALEYRVCALEECDKDGMAAMEMPQEVKTLYNEQTGTTATDKPTNF